MSDTSPDDSDMRGHADERDAPWSWSEIKSDWLAEAQLAADRDEVVEAFARVDRHFGRAWIEASRAHPGFDGSIRGSAPTLAIVILGQQLAVLEGVVRRERLLAKLRKRDPSAHAELKALNVCGGGTLGLRIEYEPTVEVGRRRPKPDFRLAFDCDPWVSVEVTRPNPADAQQQLTEAMRELADVLRVVPGSYTAEVFLHGHATSDELQLIHAQLVGLCAAGEPREAEIPRDLGMIYMNDAVPGEIVINDRGQPYTPRIGTAQSVMEDGIVRRHIAVRVPYFDLRGHRLLESEAAQLPDGGPGLIVIDMSGTAGGKEWAPVLRDALALGLFPHVSAVCLMRSGIVLTDAGEAEHLELEVIINPDARFSLPDWLLERLA